MSNDIQYDPLTGEPIPTAVPEGAEVTCRRKPGILRRILAFLFSVCLFAIMVGGLCLILLQNIMSPNTIKSITREAINIPVSALVGNMKLDFLDALDLDDDATVKDVLISLYSESFTAVGVSQDEFNDFLNSKEGAKFFENTFSVYMDDIINGKDAATLADTILDYVDDNRKTLEKEFGIKISEKEIQSIRKELDKGDYKEVLDMLSGDNLKDAISGRDSDMDIDKMMNDIRTAIKLLWFILAVATVIILLFILLILWDKAFFARYTGMALICAGGLGTGACIFLHDFILDLLMEEIPTNFKALIDVTLTTVFKGTLFSAAILLGVGVLLFVFGIISAIIMNSYARKHPETV